jgi:hypothetical protein
MFDFWVGLGDFLVAFEGFELISLMATLTEEESFELLIDLKDFVEEFWLIFDELVDFTGDVGDGQVDTTILEKHFLMMAFDLLVVAVGDEFGHMHEDLEFLAGRLALKGPFVVGKVRNVRIVLWVIPGAIFLVTSLLPLGRPSQLLAHHPPSRFLLTLCLMLHPFPTAILFLHL